MPKFRKRTEYVDAVYLDNTSDCITELANIGFPTRELVFTNGKQQHLVSLRCGAVARDGEWIVKDANGVFFACSHDTFKKQYE